MPIPFLAAGLGAAARWVAPKVAGAAVGTGIFQGAKHMLGIGDDDKGEDKPKDQPQDQNQGQQGPPQNQQQGAAGWQGPPQPQGYPPVQAAPGAAQVMQQGVPSAVMVSQTPGMLGQGQVPVMAGAAAGAGAYAVGQTAAPGVQPATAGAEKEHVPFAGQKDGRMESMGKTALAALAGGVGAFALNQKEGKDFGESLKAGLAGAGSGGFARMAYESVQANGEGMRAGMQSAAAAALGSMVKEGGPSAMASALTGGGAGLLGNKIHDSLEESGNGKGADAAAGASLAASLGYSVTGDKSTSLLAGLGGGAAGVGLGELGKEDGSLGKLIKEANPFESMGKEGKTDGPEQAQPGMA